MQESAQFQRSGGFLFSPLLLSQSPSKRNNAAATHHIYFYPFFLEFPPFPVRNPSFHPPRESGAPLRVTVGGGAYGMGDRPPRISSSVLLLRVTDRAVSLPLTDLLKTFSLLRLSPSRFVSGPWYAISPRPNEWDAYQCDSVPEPLVEDKPVEKPGAISCQGFFFCVIPPHFLDQLFN